MRRLHYFSTVSFIVSMLPSSLTVLGGAADDLLHPIHPIVAHVGAVILQRLHDPLRPLDEAVHTVMISRRVNITSSLSGMTY